MTSKIQKFPNWGKYNLRVVEYENSKAYSGEPNYPNGHLLGTVIGHTPMFENNHPVTFDRELQLIKLIVKNNTQ